MTLLSCLVGLMQMTVVMLVAGSVARGLRRRAPESAASVGLVGLIAGLCVMLMTLFNAPRVFEHHVELGPKVSVAQPLTNQPSATADSDRDVLQKTDAKPSIGFSIGDAVHGLLDQRWSGAQDLRPLIVWTFRALVILTLVAVVPIVIGLIATVRLHHTSSLVGQRDASVLQSQAIHCADRVIQFRVSEFVHAPCVTLYGRSTIYLPVGWTEWSEAELSAAIAHESAHLFRHDPLKRLIAQLTTSPMIFHPLSIWLSRGVMLSQEMAADREAANANGDQFANSLSRMALRIDSSRGHSRGLFSNKQWFMRPGIVSVSSSHLIRRIEMLTRYPTGRLSTKLRVLSHAVMIGVFAVSASFAVRADQPTDDAGQAAAMPAERVAALPARGDRGRTPLFAAPAFEPWQVLRPNHSGFVAVRVEKLLSQPVLGQALPMMVEPLFDMAWQTIATEEAAASRESLGLSLENIEHVIAGLNVTMTKKEAADGEGADGTGTVTAGSTGGMLRFKRAVSHDSVNSSINWPRVVQLLEENGIKAGDLGDTTVAEFVDQFRSDTFVDGQTSQELSLPEPKAECDADQLARLQRAWKAVDGGVLAACWTLSETIGFVENPYDELAEKILQNAACMAIGIDIATGPQPAVVRLAFLPREGAKPETVEAAIRNLLELTEQNFESLVEAAEGIENPNEIREALRSAQIQFGRMGEESTADSVLITFRGSLASLALLADF